MQAFLGEKMYAIVNIAGKQYKVSEGDKLKVARLSSDVGDKINFDDVLLTDDGKNIKIGKPTVKGSAVSAEILEHGRYPKILVYKKKRRKGYQRKNGHRQDYSAISITGINIASVAKKAAPKKNEAAPTAKKANPATKKAVPAKKPTATKSTKKETK